MKTFEINLLKVAILIATLIIAVNLSAQTKNIAHDLSAFNGVSATDFETSVIKSDAYKVEMTVNSDIADYIQSYVINNNLYLSVDKKSFPSEVKKKYNARNTPKPVIKAVVYMPELSSLSLDGEASFTGTESFKPEKFSLTTAGKSVVRNLKVISSDAQLDLSKASNVSLTVDADNLTVKQEGSSLLGLTQTSSQLKIEQSGPSSSDISGEFSEVNLVSSGSAKVKIYGNAKNLDVKGSGSSVVDALNLQTPQATVKLSGSCQLTENASDAISVELSGNSVLVFNGDPKFNIVNIKSSSVSRYSK